MLQSSAALLLQDIKYLNQSDVVIKVVWTVAGVVVELQDVKDLFGLLRLTQGMGPEHHPPPIGPVEGVTAVKTCFWHILTLLQ